MSWVVQRVVIELLGLENESWLNRFKFPESFTCVVRCHSHISYLPNLLKQFLHPIPMLPLGLLVLADFFSRPPPLNNFFYIWVNFESTQYNIWVRLSQLIRWNVTFESNLSWLIFSSSHLSHELNQGKKISSLLESELSQSFLKWNDESSQQLFLSQAQSWSSLATFHKWVVAPEACYKITKLFTVDSSCKFYRRCRMQSGDFC